jgi:FkbH-like protein
MSINNYFLNMGWLLTPSEDFSKQLKSFSKRECTAAEIQFFARHSLNINTYSKLAKIINEAIKRKDDLSPLINFNLAVVSSATISFIIPALVSTAARYGIALTVHEAPYNQVMQTALGHINCFSDLKLDAILVFVDFEGLPIKNIAKTYGEGDEVFDVAINYLLQVKDNLKSRYNAPCIINTIPQTTENLFGNIDAQVSNTQRNLIQRINNELVVGLNDSDSLLLDLASLAENVGLSIWHDPIMYNLAKLPFSQQVVPLFADHVCRLVAALRGKSRRVLVLDLDNTLWGGVIGDDGINGIKIGHGSSLGEAYLSFQQYVLQLHERGIVLAISSKNNEEIARSPFIFHEDMVLKENHISVFRANWENKATNIIKIADELNLGLDSFVFFDDNPAERKLVREQLPDVFVPEIPTDPAFYASALAAAGLFEAVYFSHEDKIRINSYADNRRRKELRESSLDMNEYLKKLNMTATYSLVNNDGLKRVVQLISKTNQFNLTTKRFSEQEVSSRMDNDKYFSLQIRLEDSFGDNGLVSVVMCERNHSNWEIDLWIMSCRVIGRHLEFSVINEIVREASKKGISHIIGRFIPTERNELVKNHYKKLGFEFVKDDDGATVWKLDVNNYHQHNAPLKVIHN